MAWVNLRAEIEEELGEYGGDQIAALEEYHNWMRAKKADGDKHRCQINGVYKKKERERKKLRYHTDANFRAKQHEKVNVWKRANPEHVRECWHRAYLEHKQIPGWIERRNEKRRADYAKAKNDPERHAKALKTRRRYREANREVILAKRRAKYAEDMRDPVKLEKVRRLRHQRYLADKAAKQKMAA